MPSQHAAGGCAAPTSGETGKAAKPLELDRPAPLESRMADSSSTVVTAAILVIGDEILSGRTKDKNIGYIAEYLTQLGIDLKQVRVVPDDETEIVEALNALRARFTYVFTTGGIGPTHDDITADCVAKAFGVSIDIDPRAVALMRQRYSEGELNEARLRMARIPAGAELIENPISRAPGFRIGNVIVMAGVPTIMQAMLDNVAPTLATGVRVLAESIDAGGLPEGLYAKALGEIAARHQSVSIGSYPSFTEGGFRNQIVVRGRDAAAVAAAVTEIKGALAGLRPDKAPA
jgi:molybdenum cofactor synthesis domain-containing protein